MRGSNKSEIIILFIAHLDFISSICVINFNKRQLPGFTTVPRPRRFTIDCFDVMLNIVCCIICLIVSGCNITLYFSWLLVLFSS